MVIERVSKLQIVLVLSQSRSRLKFQTSMLRKIKIFKNLFIYSLLNKLLNHFLNKVGYFEGV